jgi:hypothetical protein
LIVAHGVGSRTDLPLPVWLFAYGAGAALVISFVTLRILWPRPRLDALATGRVLPTWSSVGIAAAGWAARVAGLAFFVLVLVAAAVGTEESASNVAPVAVYVVFWVGLQVASAVLGDVWRVLSPFDTLALLARRGPDEPVPDATHWPAVAGIAGFVWLELCYHRPDSPRVLALALAAYTLAMAAGVVRSGRGWLRTGDGFAAWFGLLATMAPLHRDGDGRLRARLPFTGLARVEPRPGTAGLILTVLGSTAFDGVTRTAWWRSVVDTRLGWDATAVRTLGLAFTIGVVSLAYAGAMRLAARLTGEPPDSLLLPFVHSLVPIALAYAVAHYFSLVVFEGQQALALVSDPLGRGADWFGTVDWAIDYRALSTRTISYVQAGAIVVGHVVAVVVAHDRAVERFDARVATRSQVPLLAVMVAYTVAGLAILLGT